MVSRVPARLNCHFAYDGASYEGVIIDLSLNGAYIASKFLPPKDAYVTVNLMPPAAKNPIILEGKVIRGGSTVSDHGSLSRFGIRFNRQSLELLNLLASLASNR